MTTYFWSDQHFGHRRMYLEPFMSASDPKRKMREFDSQEDCENYMIDQYNQIVKDGDKVYFIGDVVMDKRSLPLLNRMNKGYKYLILGNHDDKACITKYKPYFNKVYGCKYLDKYKLVMSHFPCHERMLRRVEWGEPRFLWNLHGHTHDSYVMTKDGKARDDKYLNVSVEVVGYRPISAEELGITSDYHNKIIQSIKK